MLPTAFAATIKACHSTVRSATNACRGSAIGPWVRWARAICSPTSDSMQSGCATSARLSAPMAVCPMWLRCSGTTSAITSRGPPPCLSPAICSGGSTAMQNRLPIAIRTSRNGFDIWWKPMATPMASSRRTPTATGVCRPNGSSSSIAKTRHARPMARCSPRLMSFECCICCATSPAHRDSPLRLTSSSSRHRRWPRHLIRGSSRAWGQRGRVLSMATIRRQPTCCRWHSASCPTTVVQT